MKTLLEIIYSQVMNKSLVCGRSTQRRHQNASSDTWNDCVGQEEMAKVCAQQGSLWYFASDLIH